MLAEPMTLYKLMNLYMLHQVNFPLTNAQLSNFFLDREYTTYFTLQQALNELLDAGLVKKETMRNSSRYEITKEGEETLEFFGARNIIILEQTVQETGFEAKAEQILQEYAGQNCIVFTDLYGGSVNQIFFKNLRDHAFHLITGMNLAMILECAFTETDLDASQLKEIIANACRQTCYMNDLLTGGGEDDD